MIKLDDKKSKEGHWVSLIIDRNAAIYFNSFGIEYIPQELLNKIKDKSITHNIFRIRQNMLAGNALLDCTCLFSPNDDKRMSKEYISLLRTNIS